MKMPYSDAMQKLRSNPYSTWNPPSPEGATREHASSRIYSDLSTVYAPIDFKLGKESNFFCVGSCFARELEDAIDELGLKALTKTQSLRMVEDYPDLFRRVDGVMGRSNAFLNRYNSGSMLDLMRGIAHKEVNTALVYSNDGETHHDYHYTRFLRALSFESVIARRNCITEMYYNAARQAGVFVFTLGLSESFFDLDDGAYLNVTPDPRTARGHNLEFQFLSVQDNVEKLRGIVENVRLLNSAATVVLTVSPVPLDATFTGYDVVVANNLAKASLVAAAHVATWEFENCYYFPSFEMVMTSRQEDAWSWDKKHVSAPMVSHIMQHFIQQHVS